MTKDELKDFIDKEMPSILEEIEHEKFNDSIKEISKKKSDGNINPPELKMN